MKKIAIRGHSTHGGEVIEILEMLGGRNTYNYRADCDSLCFYIGKVTGIIYYDWVGSCYGDEDILVFSLEGFKEKFPYKVGDKVTHSMGILMTVVHMSWDAEYNVIRYDIQSPVDNNYKFKAMLSEYLQPYKEEIMKNVIDTVKESEDRYRIVLNHQFDMEVDEGEYYAVRRKPTYPQTYEECCEVLGYEPNRQSVTGYHAELIENFQKLLICRDAYWKIYGKQKGLDKPWKPASKGIVYNTFCKGVLVYSIFYCISDDTIQLFAGNLYSNNVLSFPTVEMRDTFYENFKSLIELCKKLL